MSARSKNRTNPLLWVILVTLIFLAAAGIIIYSLGYRYVKEDNVKFSGWTVNGQPTNGKLSYSDGTKGKLKKDKDSANGKITYSNGDVYEGQLDGINRTGAGKIT